MQVTNDTLNFKPPRPGRWGKPLALALVVHVLLMAALTWGVHWKQDEMPVTFEAEIWSALPREAAPRAVQPPPPPPPEPTEVKPAPQPEPQPDPAPPPPQPKTRPPDIATEKAKKKIEEDQRREQEAAKKAKADREKAEREKKEKELADKKKKAEEQKRLAEKLKQEQERQAAEKRDAQLAEKLRTDQIARMMGQVGATGGPQASGSAQRSEGPSSGYGARVQAKVRPNIRYSEEFPRSLTTDIEVRASPDGAILSRRVVRSSGNPAWDDAALKAIDRTGSLPRDVDGRVPSSIIIAIKPGD